MGRFGEGGLLLNINIYDNAVINTSDQSHRYMTVNQGE